MSSVSVKYNRGCLGVLVSKGHRSEATCFAGGVPQKKSLQLFSMMVYNPIWAKQATRYIGSPDSQDKSPDWFGSAGASIFGPASRKTFAMLLRIY